MELNRVKSFAVQAGAHPTGQGVCEFKISTERVMQKYKYAPDDVVFNLKNVPFALNSPTAVFKGLDRDGHENSYCYCAVPARRFVNDTHSLPLEPGYVFLVFVTEHFEIFDWRFEKADDKDKGVPEGYANRYGEPLWRNKR